MKKLAVYLSALLSGLFLICGCSCTSTGPEESRFEAYGLESDDIMAVYAGDYDSDGEDDAFILKGDGKMDNFTFAFPAELWYCNGAECECVSQGKQYLFNAQVQFFGETEVLILTEYGTSSRLTRFYSAEEGHPVELNLSGKGGDYEVELIGFQTEEAEENAGYLPDVTFSLLDSQYDFCEADGITCGHTWKKYYFFWDREAREFREYGGVEITDSQLLRCDDARYVFEWIEERGGVVGDIFYRDCGIVNINYSVTSDASADIKHYYVSLKLDRQGGVHYITSGEGSYSPAMLSELAVFPEVLPDCLNSK